MSQATSAMLTELREEAVTTKRVLERVPSDKLSWSPHAKSMSLGQLALHVATIPGNLTKLTQFDEFDAAQANFNPPQPKDMSEILTALEESVRSAEGYLGTMADTFASASWRLTMRGQELFTKPRIAVLR